MAVMLIMAVSGCAAIAAGTVGTILGNIGADVIEHKYPDDKGCAKP
jgi:hypothetical protein